VNRDWLDVSDVVRSRLHVRTAHDARNLLLRLLPLFEKLGKKLILRTWTVGAHPIGDLIWHRDRVLQMTRALRSEALILSFKHGDSDFFRYLPLSEVLARIDLPKIIEFQGRREYEGAGEYPSFIGWDCERFRVAPEKNLELGLEAFEEVRKEHPRAKAVVVGDGFDHIASHFRWLAKLGAFGYDSLLKVNRIYNQARKWLDKDYHSISQRVKEKVKNAVSFVAKYEEQLVVLARRKNCHGIICGHIHTPEDKTVEEIRYLNSGDWVESMSCVVEHFDGRMEVLFYSEFLKRIGEAARPVQLKAREPEEAEQKTA